MAIHKLNALKVKSASTGKYEDGAGLRLVVSKMGTKTWVLRFTIKNRRREMGLGSYPDVGLLEAREKSTNYRKQVQRGIDPIENRNTGVESIPSFTTCAARYIRSHRHGWKNYKHAKQWVRTLKTYARPVIGNKSVDNIETHHIIEILQPIWITKTETAKRIQGRIENILDFASAHKFRTQVNPARWRGHLDKLLPKPSRVRTVRHHPAMPYSEVSNFITKLTTNNSISAKALNFLILTSTRTNELMKAKWSEIDRNEKSWKIPSSRMKSRQEHSVPLPIQAIEILNKLPQHEDNPYIFPGAKLNCPLSNMALLQLMRNMNYGVHGTLGNYVPHGFRSSFRDWSSEVSSFPREVAEMALAHTIENKAEAAYRRGKLFEKRRDMMQQWADYIYK